MSRFQPVGVVLDTCTVINLAITGRLNLLARIPGYRFVVTKPVIQEVTRESQKRSLQAAIQAETIHVEKLTLEELDHFAKLRDRLGEGEAASLALARGRGWILASDEKGCLQNEACNLGVDILTTPGLYALAIAEGILSEQDADHDRQLLEKNRFLTIGPWYSAPARAGRDVRPKPGCPVKRRPQ